MIEYSFSTDKQKLIRRKLSELGVPITNLSVQKDNKEKTTEEKLYELVSNQKVLIEIIESQEILVDKQRELIEIQEQTIIFKKIYERVITIVFWIMLALFTYTVIFLI